MDNNGPNHYEELVPECVHALCPSCGRQFAVATRGLPYVEWRQLPQMECPCCGGHSDRSAFGIIEAGNPGAWCYVEENTLLTGDLGLEAIVPQDDPNTPMVPYDGQDIPAGVMGSIFAPADEPAWIDPAVTPHPSVCGEDDPHGRDPEEGTSRPYPWETAAGTLVEGRPHPMVPFPSTGGPVDPSIPWSVGEGPGPEFFIPVSPIGVPPADEFGIVDDLEETDDCS